METCKKCHNNPAEDLHECPYEYDVNDECYLPAEKRTLCNCCAACREECADEI